MKRTRDLQKGFTDAEQVALYDPMRPLRHMPPW